jgi:hypothetical protein
MCECGCGEMVPYEILDIDGKVMVVEIYRGCEDCDTGLMVSLNLFSSENATEQNLIPTKKFELDKFGWAQNNYPIVGKTDLIEAAKQMSADADFGEDGYESMTEWLEERGLELLQTALRLRLDEVAKNIKAEDKNG